MNDKRCTIQLEDTEILLKIFTFCYFSWYNNTTMVSMLARYDDNFLIFKHSVKQYSYKKKVAMMTIHAATRENNEKNLWRRKKKAKPQTQATAQPPKISICYSFPSSLFPSFFGLLSSSSSQVKCDRIGDQRKKTYLPLRAPCNPWHTKMVLIFQVKLSWWFLTAKDLLFFQALLKPC